MADPLNPPAPSRRALLNGSFLKDLMGPSELPGQPVRSLAVPAAKPSTTQPPLAEVQVYGSNRPVTPLSVEDAAGESPPPWSRK